MLMHMCCVLVIKFNYSQTNNSKKKIFFKNAVHVFLQLFQSHRTGKISAGRKRHYDLKMHQKLRIFWTSWSFDVDFLSS